MTTIRSLTIAGCACALFSTAVAQEILAPPPAEYAPPPPTPLSPGYAAAQPEATAPEEVLAAGQQALAWGVAHFHPRLMYRLSYGDGLPARPGEDVKTWIQELIPGITINIGDKWAVDYTPAFRFYSNDKFRDTIDHTVSLHGETAYNDWLFGFSHMSALTSDPLIETGQQTDQEQHVTSLSGVYQINSEVSLELGLNQSLRFAEQFTDSMQWSTIDWLNYQLAPHLGVAFGLGGGYLDMSEGSDMTFEQVLGRVTFAAGEKLTFSGNGGADIRQFLDSGLNTLVNPIFGLSANYMPFEATTLTVSGGRSVNASYYSSQITEDTFLSAGLRQRFFEKLFLNVAGGYRISSYQASAVGINVSREDKGPFFSVSLNMTILKRGTAGVFYYYSENTSTTGGYGYSSSQVGLEIGYRF